jgi:superfamily I DNA/RNA helicase
MFETQEEYEIVKQKTIQQLKIKGLSDEEIKFRVQKEMQEALEDIRKIRKNHFWMKTGTAKLSTTHSFKGWETETLFLIIENEEDGSDFTNDELIYTGLTRAKKNLIIFNLNNYKYDSFFKSVIEQQFEIGHSPFVL